MILVSLSDHEKSSAVGTDFAESITRVWRFALSI